MMMKHRYKCKKPSTKAIRGFMVVCITAILLYRLWGILTVTDADNRKLTTHPTSQLVSVLDRTLTVGLEVKRTIQPPQGNTSLSVFLTASTNVPDNIPSSPVAFTIDFDLPQVVRSNNSPTSWSAGAASYPVATLESGGQARNINYVSYCPLLLDGRRVGNRLFNVAALLHVAWRTGRRAAIPTNNGYYGEDDQSGAKKYDWHIDEIFDQLADRKLIERAGYEVICETGMSAWNGLVSMGKCADVIEEHSMVYDTQWESIIDKNKNKSLLLCGYFQSWKYFKDSETRLRRVLSFSHSINHVAERFLSDARPVDWSPGSFSTVSVHVRRGDLMKASNQRYGYVVPPAGFYLRAARLFVHRHDRVLYVVASDDPPWARKVLTGLNRAHQHHRTAVVFTEDLNNTAAEVDLAILARCRDGAIVSTGTFGWWAAWLADPPTVVYFAGTPKRGSTLGNAFRREDYAPPHWIPQY